MHPYEVSQTLRSRSAHDAVRLNYGSLYSVVASLEKKGFVRIRETIREGRRPERTIYEITDLGSRELVDWLSDLVATPVKEYLQFEAALAFLAGLAPEDALAQLRERHETLRREVVASQAARQSATSEGLPRLFILEAEYVGMLREAEMEWVEALIKDIEDGSLDGLEYWRSWYAN